MARYFGICGSKGIVVDAGTQHSLKGFLLTVQILYCAQHSPTAVTSQAIIT